MKRKSKISELGRGRGRICPYVTQLATPSGNQLLSDCRNQLRLIWKEPLKSLHHEMRGCSRHIGAWVYQRLRSEEHTSELQSLMRISYAVFCLKNKTNNKHIYMTTLNIQSSSDKSPT